MFEAIGFGFGLLALACVAMIVRLRKSGKTGPNSRQRVGEKIVAVKGK